MTNISLIRLDTAIEDTLIANPDYVRALTQEDWEQVAALVHQVVGRTLPTLSTEADTLHWGGYLATDPATQEVVGSCAFKAPPTDKGIVEIAYFT